MTPQGENVVILFVTRIKQEALTQYVDALSGDLLFWEGQEKHGTDDRVIDAQKTGDEIHLFYREIPLPGTDAGYSAAWTRSGGWPDA